MKCENNISNNLLSRMPCQDNHTQFWALMALVIISLIFWACPAIAANGFTVDSIADEMLATEAKFTDLRLDYVKMNYTPETKQLRSVEARYAHKVVTTENAAKRLRYLDTRVSMLDPNTNLTTLQTDASVSFDGQATTILDRLVDSNQPMRGAIYPGFRQASYPTLDRDPHTIIWYFGSTELLGDLIKKNRDTFRIESTSEIVNGISTVKLVGSILSGKAHMILWVSPERNFLPMKRHIIRNKDEWLLSETLLSNLVQLPSGMWYPEAIQHGNPDPEFASTYSISQISLDPIPEDFFSFEFPSNTHVIDDVLKISYTTY